MQVVGVRGPWRGGGRPAGPQDPGCSNDVTRIIEARRSGPVNRPGVAEPRLTRKRDRNEICRPRRGPDYVHFRQRMSAYSAAAPFFGRPQLRFGMRGDRTAWYWHNDFEPWIGLYRKRF